MGDFYWCRIRRCPKFQAAIQIAIFCASLYAFILFEFPSQRRGEESMNKCVCTCSPVGWAVDWKGGPSYAGHLLTTFLTLECMRSEAHRRLSDTTLQEPCTWVQSAAPAHLVRYFLGWIGGLCIISFLVRAVVLHHRHMKTGIERETLLQFKNSMELKWMLRQVPQNAVWRTYNY